MKDKLSKPFDQGIKGSIQFKIVLWAGLCLVLATSVLIGHSAVTLRTSAIDSAKREAIVITEVQAGHIKSQLDPALDTARTIAYSFGTVKDSEHPISLTRDQANAILRKVLEENPNFLGTWTIWEPNAFDGLDANFANTPIHDQSGRFIPYWVRSGPDSIEGVAIVDYETPGAGDFYILPRQTKNETLIPPYFYSIDGEDVMMTSLVVPIVEKDRFYGVTGVDIKVDFVQSIMNDVNLYGGTATAALFTDKGLLVAVRNQPELALQPATILFQDFEHVQPQLNESSALISQSPDGKYLRVFSPIEFGNSGTHWYVALIIPFEKITETATSATVRQASISIGLLALAGLLLWYLTVQLVKPIRSLTEVANTLAAGNLDVVAELRSNDEIGILANAFNTMTSQLRGLFSTLEQRVVDRTRNLEFAAEVGRAVSQVRDLDVMLKDAAEIIRSRFNLYYAQVYLTNASQTELFLQAGTGKVGEQLLARSHKLALNTKSINGRAAVEKRSVVISETESSADFQANPLLPDTRSEIAVPLIVSGKVVGVLDIQSTQSGALNQENLVAFEALAGQLAVAIQNSNLLAETVRSQAEVENQLRRLARVNWQDYLDAIHKPEHTSFVFDGSDVMAVADLSQLQTSAEGNTNSVAIEVMGQPIGSIVVQGLTADKLEIVNVIAGQVAQQIESLRLLESAERYRVEAEDAARRTTVEGWRKYIESRPENVLAYRYEAEEVQELSEIPANAALTLPIKVGAENIGQFSVHDIESEAGQPLDIAKAVIERLGAHIDNLRLIEETKHGQLELSKRAQDLAAVSEISSASAKELNIQKLLESVVHLTQRKFGLYHAHIFTFDEATSELQIAACGWKEGEEHEGTHGTTTIALGQEQSLVARAGRTRQPIIVNDVSNEPGWLPNPLLPDTRSEMAVPVIIGDQLLGVLDVQSDQLNAFSLEDASIQVTLAAQIATALQNARSFERAQRQAERESIVNMIGQKIQSATSVEAVLQIAARELGRAFGAQFSVAQLGVHAKNGKNKLTENSN